MNRLQRILRRLRGEQVDPQSGPKSYLYVSDEKVQMLIQGLPERLRDKFDLKAKIGLPELSGFSAGVEITQRHLDEGRFVRTERLCAALREQGRIGDLLSHDTEFIEGEMLMTWGFWNRSNSAYADVVGFGGFPTEGVNIFLGGSAYFTIERAADRLQQYSNSGLQQLMQFFFERHRSETEGQTALPGAWYAETWDADRDNPLVPERLEFVAQRYKDDTSDQFGIRSILGSPIYVARSRRLPTRNEMQNYQQLRKGMLVSIYQPGTPERLEAGELGRGKPSTPQFIGQRPAAAVEAAQLGFSVMMGSQPEPHEVERES